LDPRVAEFATGEEVTITAHVVREGYVKSAGPNSIRYPIDVETEHIASANGGADLECKIRLTMAEAVAEQSQNPGARTNECQSDAGSRCLTYGTRFRLSGLLV
jgi:hypothetical protein